MIVNMSMNKTWCVYKHTSPSSKVYIGVTHDINERWSGKGKRYKGSTRIHNAIKKYGWDSFRHEVLFSGLTREDAYQKERELIAEYMSTDPRYGYNLQAGGMNGIHDQESRNKISVALRGHSVSDSARRAVSDARSICIVCLETGIEYKNAKEASIALNLCHTSILKVARGIQESCGGLHFARKDDIESEKIPKFKTKETQYGKVICLDNGIVYENISDASRKTGLSRRGISYVCNGTHKTCGKMRWAFIEQNKHK